MYRNNGLSSLDHFGDDLKKANSLINEMECDDNLNAYTVRLRAPLRRLPTLNVNQSRISKAAQAELYRALIHR